MALIDVEVGAPLKLILSIAIIHLASPSLVNMRLLAIASLFEGGRQQGMEVEDELEVVVTRMVKIALEEPLAPTN